MHCVPARTYSEPDYFVDLTEMKDAEAGQASNRLMAETELHSSTGSRNKVRLSFTPTDGDWLILMGKQFVHDIYSLCWSVRFWLLLWHFTAMFTTPWAVWAGVSASQVGATEETMSVTGKIKMSDLYWRWGTKLCTVILVTRTTERITPVYVPGKQVGKVIAGTGKNLSFRNKIFCFWFIFCVQAIPQDFYTQPTPYQKENKQKKKKRSAGHIMGVSFSYTWSCIVPSAPILAQAAVPGCHCTRALSLGEDADLSELSPSLECCCAANQAAGPWAEICCHCFGASVSVECHLPVIHLASLKPRPEDLAVFCPKKDHSAAHNCSSRGSLNTWLKRKLMKVALNTKFLLAASPSTCDVAS